MRGLVIGKNGFLSSSLQKNKLLKDNFLFVSPYDLGSIKKNDINIKRIILLSFDPKWKNESGYDCLIEKELLEKVGSEDILIQYFSTSKVYANSKVSINEKEKINPSSVYAKNKFIAENFIIKNFKNYHIFRTSNIFNNNGGASNTFLDIFLKNLKKKIISFDVNSQSERDFVTTDFISELLSIKEIPNTGIYNLSSSIPIKIDEVIKTILSSNEIDIKKLNIEYGHKVTNQILSNTKLLKSFKITGLTKKILLQEFGGINAK